MVRTHSFKSVVLASASLTAVILASFQPAAAQQAAATGVEEVSVTGTRIKNGFQTPNPVTVVEASDLNASAPGNLADGLNQLPNFSGSTNTYQATGGGLASGTVGQDLLNMRGLGANRVLVLLDGRRVISTNNNGSVDINVIPQNLVKRVDVVTGGASAAYGSDAVTGVVNFVLDTTFDGVKGGLQGGTSTYNDSQSFRGNIAAGHQFFGGALRVVASAEYFQQAGVGILDKPTGRAWYDSPSGQIPNPNGTVPTVLVVPNLKAALGSYGGLISSGALKGTQFLAGGVSAPFTYGLGGTGTGTYMSGGDSLAGDPGQSLSPNQKRVTGFVHAEYDLTPGIELFTEFLYAQADITNQGALNFGTGSSAQLTIFRDNAYLPSDILTRMVAANAQSVPLGRYYLEFGPVQNESIVTVDRGVIGLKGNVFGNWAWDTTFSRSASFQKLAKNNEPNMRNFFAASDSVRDGSGNIVCRSTLSGFDAGCVPMNPFGLGSVSQAASKYILGNSVGQLYLNQTVANANITGDFGDKFQLGAGPISVAAGFEYRKEEASQTSDAVSQQILTSTGLKSGVMPTSLNNRLGVYQFYNPQPFAGSYDIREGNLEFGVPLLKDFVLAKSLDLDLAGRYTDYSQSGGVQTWKLGFNWQATDELRLRYTKSQDIRGPNVVELFNTQTQQNQTVLFKGATVSDTALTSGNQNLSPERAVTQTYGAVYRPDWLSGFGFSLDRYEITINNAIGSLTAQQTADQCTAGNSTACGQITVQSNGSLIVRLQPLNLSLQKNTGYDLEATYDTDIGGGSLGLHALVNHTTDAFLIAPGSARVSSLGLPIQPKWRTFLSAQYSYDVWSVFASETIIGASVIDPTKVAGVDTSSNALPAIAYTNLTASYRFDAWDVKAVEAYFTINNLFDKDPPFSGGNPSSYNAPVSTGYDTMGRYFYVGLRFGL